MGKRGGISPVVIGLGLGALALAFWRREDIAAAGRIIGQEIDDVRFNLAIPLAARTYAGIIRQVATEESVDPFIIVGIGWRESNWGTSSSLDVPGPGGTGDFTGRVGDWLDVEGLVVVDQLPEHWHAPKDTNGNVIPGPYAIPPDDRGFGRGLMQIDYANAVGFNWADPYANVQRGARMLNQKMDYLAAKGVPKDQLLEASVSAYNHGEGTVVKNASMRSTDYSRWVLTRVVEYKKAAGLVA